MLDTLLDDLNATSRQYKQNRSYSPISHSHSSSSFHSNHVTDASTNSLNRLKSHEYGHYSPGMYHHTHTHTHFSL